MLDFLCRKSLVGKPDISETWKGSGFSRTGDASGGHNGTIGIGYCVNICEETRVTEKVHGRCGIKNDPVRVDNTTLMSETHVWTGV